MDFCMITDCKEPATERALITIGGFDKNDSTYMDYQVMPIDICTRHHRLMAEQKVGMHDFSIGRAHRPDCLYSVQGGWECAPGCTAGVSGLHSV
jgi:hypothetical protein